MKKKLKNFQFTLILHHHVNEKTKKLEDSLFSAGCDDALVFFKNGTAYLDFDRESTSFKQAVLSAIKHVELSKLELIVSSVAPDNFVTESEIAQRLSLRRQAVSLWIKGHRRADIPFPRPKLKLSHKSPLWKWTEILEWLDDEQLPEKKEWIEHAAFIEDINAALEERNCKTRKTRRELLKQIKAH